VIDLYACLGVDRGATASAVNKAYRRAAKHAHPDAGGSPRQFELIKLARDVLCDPTRRARYDATGDATETVPDTSLAKALNLIAGTFDTVMQQAVVAASPERFDLVGQAVGMLKQRNAQLTAQKDALSALAATWDRLSGRFRRKSEGDNLLAAVAIGKANTARQTIAQLEGHLQVNTDALAILVDYTFQYEPSMHTNMAEAMNAAPRPMERRRR